MKIIINLSEELVQRFGVGHPDIEFFVDSKSVQWTTDEEWGREKMTISPESIFDYMGDIIMEIKDYLSTLEEPKGFSDIPMNPGAGL